MSLKRASIRAAFFAATSFVLAAAADLARADTLHAWGINGNGQLGYGDPGDPSYSADPVATMDLPSGASAVAANSSSSFAIVNGGVYAWGDNSDGGLGIGTHSGNQFRPVQISGSLSSGVSAISSRYSSTLALRNGGVYVWGDNGDGELGLGNNTSAFSPTPLTGNLSSGVSAIASGTNFSFAIRNGGVYSWGYNGNGALGNSNNTDSNLPAQLTGALSSGVTAISGGEAHALAIRNGGVYAWGDNFRGQLGRGTDHDGSYSTPQQLSGILSSGVTAVSAGDAFSLAVRGGAVYAWGDNHVGELGLGDTANRNVPTQVDSADLKNITAVAAAEASSYALSADGSIWAWGYNQTGQLGIGNNTYSYSSPQHLLAPTGYAYTSVSSANYHVLTTLATIASFGDVNGDNLVNIADLGALATHYGQSGTNLPGDINGDGVVNIADLGILATHYGFGSTSTEPPLADALKALSLPSVPEPAILGPTSIVLCGLRRGRKMSAGS